MVVILYEDGTAGTAQKIASDLLAAFSSHVQIDLIAAEACLSWPTDASWDDLLIVVYGSKSFPDVGNSFIGRHLEQRAHSAMLLPVAVDPTSRRPPAAAAAIKALEYDRAAESPSGRLANRVGGMLGLRVQGRDSKIFISYRATDGTAIAKQLFNHLVSLGHSP